VQAPLRRRIAPAESERCVIRVAIGGAPLDYCGRPDPASPRVGVAARRQTYSPKPCRGLLSYSGRAHTVRNSAAPELRRMANK